MDEQGSTASGCAGVVATACTQGKRAQHGKPGGVVGRGDQPEAGDGQAGRGRVAERSAVPRKPGNAGGAKGPQFKTDADTWRGSGEWVSLQPRKCSEASGDVACESEGIAGYRFYVLYDKVSGHDVLPVRWDQSCSVQAEWPGVDGQTFADIETYGVTGGWQNDEDLGRRRIARRRCDEFYIPKPDGKHNGHWEYRPSGTGCADGGGAGAWTRSSRPIFHRSSTPTDRAKAHLDGGEGSSTL